MRLFDQASIVKLRLLLLFMVILLTSPLTYQLLMGTSNLSMASFANIQSTPMAAKTLTVPANNFSVISGSISGLADSSIYTNVDRVRAAMTSPVPGVVSASYYFKILGSSPTVLPDSDGVTRQGVVFWVNMHNACNLYFLFWRTDSTKPAGTTVVGAKVQVNPTITSLDVNHSDLIACAGVGYSTISQPDGTPAEISSNTNIMDGNWHNFTVVKLGPERWRLYTDSVLAFEAYDPSNNFPIDSNLWGLRLDNVQIQLYYQLTISTSQLFSTSFTAQPPSGQTGQSISFSASTIGGSPPYAYSWNFGDGSTGTGSSVTHTYSSAGSFNVILTIKDAGSPQQTATSQQTISVTNPSSTLTASFTYTPSSPQTGQSVTFTGTASGGTSPYTFTWSFGDGSTGTGASTTHTYSLVGSYVVTLTVVDSGSPQQTTTSQRTISVANPPPLSAGLTFSPASPDAGQSVSFTASASGGTSPYSYSWSFGDGGTASGNLVSHSFASAGSYTVTLSVTDSGGQRAQASKTVAVNAQLSGSFSYSPSSPLPLEAVTFSATGSGGAQPYSYSWDFGDGTTANGQTVRHSYLLPGSYVVTLTITDASGQRFTTSQTVIVLTNIV